MVIKGLNFLQLCKLKSLWDRVPGNYIVEDKIKA